MAAPPLSNAAATHLAATSVDIDARARGQAGLAGLAFASVEGPDEGAGQHTQARHLAFLPPESLDLDLANPAHRDFGDYELVEKLGQGGMGVVYRARQKSLDREVALKLLAAGPWASADFIARFRREAQSAARMQHPNIVPIYEIGAHEELNFFSMMLVRGESLAARLHREGPFEPRVAAALLRTVAEAVDYAHRLGVLHLDLKPGNVLLDERGEAQVADFGLARRIDDTLGADNDEVSGTPSYMAPEQATLKTHKLSPATDVYGLGAILYEFLTGRPPFLAASPQETLKRVVAAQPERPRALRADVAVDLEAICLKCLEKDPRERYASARVLADDLGRYLDGRAVSVRPLNALQRAQRWARREPRVAVALAAFVFALVSGLVATAMQWQRADANAARANANAARANATAWAQRRDAIWRAFDERRWFDALPLLVANIREQEAQGAMSEAALDRRRLGTLLAASPELVDAIRVEAPTANALHGPVVELALSPDASTLAATTMNGSVAAIDVASGTVRWKRAAGAVRAGRESAFSADGRFFSAGICDQPSLYSGCVTRYEIASGQAEPKPPAFARLDGMRFSPDGRLALLTSDQREHQVWRTDPWQPLSEVLKSDERTIATFATDGTVLSFDAAGQRALVLAGAPWRPQLALDPPTGSTYTQAASDLGGRYFALATSAGTVELVDHVDMTRRQLPSPCGKPMAMVAFSVDDAWVLGACDDHTVRAWDVATGKLVAAPIAHGRRVQHVSAEAASRLVQVWAWGGNNLWRLPESPSEFAVAVLAAPTLGNGNDTMAHSIALDSGTGLLAMGSNDGLVRLWRLRGSAMLPRPAPPMPGATLRFDGRHVIVAEDSVVEVVDVRTGTAASVPLEHAQPVSQAILGADGATLVAVSGRELHVWDWRGGVARHEPIVLPASPAWLALDDRGARALVGWHEIRDGRPQAVLRVLRIADGETEAEVAVASGIAAVRIDGDAWVVIRRFREVEVLRLSDLARVQPNRAWPDESGAPTLLSDARMDPEALWVTSKSTIASMVARRADAILQHPRLVRWPLAEAPPQASDVTGFNQRFMPRGDGGIALAAQLPTELRHIQRDPAGRLQWLEQPSDGENFFALAYNAEGTLLARGLRDGVIVTDAASGAPLSPPLRAALDAGDVVIQLAFAPDSGSILALTAAGRWLHWKIEPDRRPVERFERQAALLAPPKAVLFFEQAPAPDRGLRAELRASDPGPIDLRARPRIVDPNLQPLAAPANIDRRWADPRFADLARWFTPIPDRPPYATGLELRSVPLGLQRLDGVDFLIRGRVQMGRPASVPEVPIGTLHATLDRIAVPPELARLHLLLGDFRPRFHEGPVLSATLHYRDGGELRRAIAFPQPNSRRINHAEPLIDIVTAAAAGARMAWVGDGIDTAPDLAPVVPIYRLTVDNPEPGRAVANVSLTAHSNPVLLAMTAEPPGADPGTPGAP